MATKTTAIGRQQKLKKGSFKFVTPVPKLENLIFQYSNAYNRRLAT